MLEEDSSVYIHYSERSKRDMSSFWKPGSSQTASSSLAPKAAAGKPKLSGNVMSMKFMKRKDDMDEVFEEEERKRRRLLHYEDSGGGEGEPALVPSTVSKLVVTVEKVSLYSSLPGRRSFRGANKIIERQYTNTMESQRIDKKYGSSSSSSEDLDVEELLKRYAAMRKGKGGAGKGDKKDKKKQKKQ